MGFFTAVSRVLGFVRDCLIAVHYGTSDVAQAFVVAFRIPNLLRDMVAEGAANSAFIPVLSQTRQKEGTKGWKLLAQALWSRIIIGFVGLSALGVIGAPWLVLFVAPGFENDPQLLAHAVRLTRILFPLIGLVAASAFCMGVLNSIHHFTLPSMGPAILNICMITGIYCWRPDALGLSWGVIVGGIIQLCIQLPALSRAGISLRINVRTHPGVARIRRLLVPRIAGTGVYQISVLVDTIFASFPILVGTGGIAALYFAQRFLQLPMALFGISLAQAALPAMSGFVAAGDKKAVKETCLTALRSSLFVAIPASAGLIVMARPIIATLLERGAFSSLATDQTVVTLQWYAVGLASMCSVKVLANTLYAFHDTWTPVKAAAVALTANIVLNFMLVWKMGLAGLALATSLSSTLNGFQLYRAVKKKIGPFNRKLRYWLLRVAAAAAAMGFWVAGMWNSGVRTFGWTHPAALIGWLGAVIVSGILIFLLFGFLLKVEEASQFGRWAAARFLKAAQKP
ncbi:MAG: murein biosynthesis integral membrane protein MurJ [Candidatus Omnitrophica bacterium]|nr:murein biosynthesis integral membrane protein MurJ [Candidatus Omnitrophota bacterium]